METPNIHESVFLTAEQCAAKLQMSRWTIYHWISGWELDPTKGLRRVGRRRLIDWDVLKAAIERGDLG
jgi:hypothetical protein